jgi:uncharacterized protein with PQ loop repeat
MVFATNKTAEVMVFWYKEIKMINTKIKENVNLAQQTQFLIGLELDAIHAILTKKLSETEMEGMSAENQIAELDIIPLLKVNNLGAILI